MSSLKIVIMPLVIFAAILFLWFSVRPIFIEAGKNRGVNKKIVENQIREEKELQRRTDSLYEEQKDLRNQSNPIINAVPGSEEIKNLLAQIEFVVQKEGMIISSVSVQDSGEGGDSAGGPSVSTSQAFSELNGDLSVKGSYLQFKQLLQSLEQLDRVLNVYSISVGSGGDSSSGGGQFSIKFKAYYQPLITAEKMRSALESKDIAN